MAYQSVRFAKLIGLFVVTFLSSFFIGCGGGASDGEQFDSPDYNDEVPEANLNQLQNELREVNSKLERSEQANLSLQNEIKDLEQQIKDLEEEVEKQGWRWKAILLGIGLLIGLPTVYLMAPSLKTNKAEPQKDLKNCPQCGWDLEPKQSVCDNPDCKLRFF